MSREEELVKAGWVRLGTHSIYWKAPDDLGPSGRKWTLSPAHAELLKRKAAEPPKAKPAQRKKKTATAKKAD
jgi:hypothetical protein